MENPDPSVRERAANDWAAWEDAVVALEPDAKPGFYSAKSPAALIAFVRITTHYCAHGAWLEDGALIRDAGRLAGIPGVLIHGRLDLSCPIETAWELAQAWPDAELIAVDGAGHQGHDGKRAAKLDAFARFA
jgi:proline iminopeptidase